MSGMDSVAASIRVSFWPIRDQLVRHLRCRKSRAAFHEGSRWLFDAIQPMVATVSLAKPALKEVHSIEACFDNLVGQFFRARKHDFVAAIHLN
jgi:hypothetical protein